MTDGRDVGGRVLRLSDLTWPDVRDAIAAGTDTALFAVASTEQHGPHLPLATDTLLGEALCERVARGLGGTFIAPPITVGLSGIHMDFPGSLTVDGATLRATVGGYCESLARHGIAKIVAIPSHGGNFAAVQETIALRAGTTPTAQVTTFADWPALRAAFASILADEDMSLEPAGLHAGEVETSMMLHLHPELVRMSLAQPGYTGASGDGRPYSRSIAEVSPIGVLGDPRTASAKRGARYVDAWVRLVIDAVRSIR
jgi:creatinine amidohydrolase